MFVGTIELLIIVLGFFGGLGVPLGTPPAELDERVVRFAPQDCLAYVGWSGIAKAEANANPTETWLAQPGVKQAMEKLRTAIRTRELLVFERQFSREMSKSRERALEFLKVTTARVTEAPTALFVSRFAVDEVGIRELAGAGLILLDSVETGVQEAFEQWKQEIKLAQPDPLLTVVETRAGTGIAVQLPREHQLVVVVRPEMVLFGSSVEWIERGWDNLATPAPDWLREMVARWPVDRVSSMARVNVARLWHEIPEDLLRNLKSETVFHEWPGELMAFSHVSGLDEHGFLSQTEIEIPNRQWELLRVIDGDPLNREKLDSIHADAVMAFVGRVDSSAVFELVRRIAIDRGMQAAFKDAMDQADRFTGVDLEEQIVKDLGNLVTFSVGLRVPFSWHWRASVQIENEMEFPAVWEQLNQTMQTSLKQMGLEGTLTERIQDHRKRYDFQPDKPGFPWGFTSSWTIADDQLWMVGGQGGLEEEFQPAVPLNRQWFRQPATERMFAVGERDDLEGPIAALHVNWLSLFRPMKGLQPFLQNETKLDRRFDFRWSDIPPMDEWTAGVQPSLAGLFRSDRGLYLRQRQTYPSASITASVAALVLIAAPEAVSEYFQQE